MFKCESFKNINIGKSAAKWRIAEGSTIIPKGSRVTSDW